MRIDTQGTLAKRIAAWRKADLRIAWTNGVFDILHLGHIGCLQYAKDQCDRLIVGVDDDASVKALKGPGRPINKAEDRARVVRNLRMVDAVIIFSADILDPLIAGIAPDVIVKGGEYANQTIVGAQHADHVLFAPMVADLSTSRIVERIAGADARKIAGGSELRPSHGRVGVENEPRKRRSRQDRDEDCNSEELARLPGHSG